MGGPAGGELLMGAEDDGRRRRPWDSGWRGRGSGGGGKTGVRGVACVRATTGRGFYFGDGSPTRRRGRREGVGGTHTNSKYDDAKMRARWNRRGGRVLAMAVGRHVHVYVIHGKSTSTALNTHKNPGRSSRCWPNPQLRKRLMMANCAINQGTPPPVGPWCRRNFIPRRPNSAKNQTGLPDPNPKPTPAWLGGWMR